MQLENTSNTKNSLAFRIIIVLNRIKSYHSGLAINHRNRIFAYQIVSNEQQGLQFRIKHRLETD